ncbi:MAG: glycosyltransferase family 2 protein [Treponemataceae bacterium]
MQNKLTVLMPTYNRANYITQAVNSVLAQKTNFGIKLIITDDCSTDGTVELIKNLQEKYPEKIEIILSDKNERLLANILKAQSRVETEYFCVLDPDDYYTDENFLQKAVDYLEAHKDFTIYSSNCMMLFEDSTKSPFIKAITKQAVFTFDDLLSSNVIITQTAGSVFRNVIYNDGIPQIIKDAIGTPSEASFRADTERYIMHLEKGKAFFKNEIVAIYRIHKDGIWTKTNQFHRNLLSAQAYYDYFRYFDYKYGEYFLTRSLGFAKSCFSELQKAIDTQNFSQTFLKEDVERLFTIIAEDEKFIKKMNINNKKSKVTFKKIIKCLLPYGLVRFIQDGRK